MANHQIECATSHSLRTYVGESDKSICPSSPQTSRHRRGTTMTQPFKFQALHGPLPGWSPASADRPTSRFDAKLLVIVTDLERELHHIGAAERGAISSCREPSIGRSDGWRHQIWGEGDPPRRATYDRKEQPRPAGVRLRHLPAPSVALQRRTVLAPQSSGDLQNARSVTGRRATWGVVRTPIRGLGRNRGHLKRYVSPGAPRRDRPRRYRQPQP